jgi:hypothetical protein
MADNFIRCRACGKLYAPCANAAILKEAFRWRAVACSPECFAVYAEQITKLRSKTAPNSEAGEADSAASPLAGAPEVADVAVASCGASGDGEGNITSAEAADTGGAGEGNGSDVGAEEYDGESAGNGESAVAAIARRIKPKWRRRAAEAAAALAEKNGGGDND